MSWLFVYGLIEWVIRLGMVPVILRRRFVPATSLAWLSVIFFLPLPGFIVYQLVGTDYMIRKRVRLHRRAMRRLKSPARLASQQAHVVRPETDPAQRPVVLQAQRISGMPIFGGNQVELLTDSAETIDRLIADIDASEHHVHLLFYIFAADDMGRKVADALVRAVQRGVPCRVLADASGSYNFFSRRGLARSLNDQGVQTYPTLPVRLLRTRLQRLDLRNHRKLAVIDGRCAYAGSQNIVDPDYGHRRAGAWIDLSARFTGPIVAQLQVVFLEDWMFETGQNLDGSDILPALEPTGDVFAQAVPTGPNQESQTLLRVVVAAMNAARKEIVITSPYLVPDEPTMLALSMAAERGVEVDLVLPQRSDHPLVGAAGRAYFEPLLEAGVHIYLHHGGILHAKTMTVDDSFALLGSSNLDIRSFYLNFELNVLLYGPRITGELRSAQGRYISQAEPVDLAQWRRRPALRRYANAAAALLSPLL